MRKIFFYILTLVSGTALAQSTEEKPKVVIGIVVDQMRQEYLYRFYNKFGEGGFNRREQHLVSYQFQTNFR